ncbi:hypothetical protein [Bacillus sp. 3255]|uniref:hypothetical protein n=1 Tax=Bacillus sp. 3255 TaxID=2817904 RepID=UPI00285DA04C|nr:hypothetical protein [Bacillus sp. 3255]MDR6885330.1 hypothetical protein [Bacillus sp. 3255]
MLNKWLGWIALVLPWLSLFVMKRNSIYRYMPVSILAALLLTIVSEIAYRYKWWEIKTSIVPWGYVTGVSFTFGVFMVGMMWVCHFTFGRVWLYVVINLALDLFFSYVGIPIAERMGIWGMVNAKQYHIFLIMTGLSFMLYLYQLWQERAYRKLEEEDGEELTIRISTPTWGTREKAK